MHLMSPPTFLFLLFLNFFPFQLRDRNKENPDKPWITSLNEFRLEKIQEASNKNGAQEMMLHFMGIYDRFFDEVVKRRELGMLPAFIGEVYIISI